MKWIIVAIGALAALLGGLWLVQGLGLVTMAPILCVAECETLEGPSAGWALAGAALFAGGLAAIVLPLRGGRRR